MDELKGPGRPPKPDGPKETITLRLDSVIKRDAYEAARQRRETVGVAVERFLKGYIARTRRMNRDGL